MFSLEKPPEKTEVEQFIDTFVESAGLFAIDTTLANIAPDEKITESPVLFSDVTRAGKVPSQEMFAAGPDLLIKTTFPETLQWLD